MFFNFAFANSTDHTCLRSYLSVPSSVTVQITHNFQIISGIVIGLVFFSLCSAGLWFRTLHAFSCKPHAQSACHDVSCANTGISAKTKTLSLLAETRGTFASTVLASAKRKASCVTTSHQFNVAIILIILPIKNKPLTASIGLVRISQL